MKTIMKMCQQLNLCEIYIVLCIIFATQLKAWNHFFWSYIIRKKKNKKQKKPPNPTILKILDSKQSGQNLEGHVFQKEEGKLGKVPKSSVQFTVAPRALEFNITVTLGWELSQGSRFRLPEKLEIEKEMHGEERSCRLGGPQLPTNTP